MWFLLRRNDNTKHISISRIVTISYKLECMEFFNPFNPWKSVSKKLTPACLCEAHGNPEGGRFNSTLRHSTFDRFLIYYLFVYHLFVFFLPQKAYKKNKRNKVLPQMRRFFLPQSGKLIISYMTVRYLYQTISYEWKFS